jgi:hypothetical protein
LVGTDSSDYFTSTVHRVLGSFLAAEGFHEHSATSTRVTCLRGDLAVSFAWFVEDLPDPWVAIEIGLRSPDGLQLCGLWKEMPAGSAAAEYPTWRFRDEESLDLVLSRLLDEVLRPYGVPVWNDHERVESMLSRQADEAESRYLAGQRDADLRRARRAFDEGRFQDSVDSYVQVDGAALTAGDRRRLHLARKQLSL